jgi:hypothetical protein
MRNCLLVALLAFGVVALTDRDGTAQATKKEGKEGPPPEPGTLIPPFVRDKLKLSADQQRRVIALELTMRGKLAKVLTDAQMKTFEDTLKEGPPPKDGNDKKGPPKGKEGGPPTMPGLVIPPFVEGKLQLTAAQKKKIAELDRSARTDLSRIFTPAQRTLFNELLRRGPDQMNGKDGGPGGDRKAPPNNQPPELAPPPGGN